MRPFCRLTVNCYRSKGRWEGAHHIYNCCWCRGRFGKEPDEINKKDTFCCSSSFASHKKNFHFIFFRYLSLSPTLANKMMSWLRGRRRRRPEKDPSPKNRSISSPISPNAPVHVRRIQDMMRCIFIILLGSGGNNGGASHRPCQSMTWMNEFLTKEDNNMRGRDTKKLMIHGICFLSRNTWDNYR